MTEKEDFYIEIDEDLYKIYAEYAKKRNYQSVDEFVVSTIRSVMSSLEMKRQGYSDLIAYFKRHGLTDLELLVFTRCECNGDELLDVADSLSLTQDETEDILISACDKFIDCFRFGVEDER